MPSLFLRRLSRSRMPKTKTKSRPAPRGRVAHQAEREQWNRRLIVGGVVAVIAVVIGIIAFGWYQTQIKPLGKTILRVEDTKFSLAHLERRVRADMDYYSADTYLQLIDDVLFRLQREASLLEGAGELDLSVSEEDVTAEVRERGNLAEDVEPNIFAAEFRRQVEDSGLSENEYRQKLRAELTEEKVRNYFRFLAPTDEPQARGRWIVLDDVEEADEAAQRLEDGEDFAELAKEFSIDSANAEDGGAFDWTPRGVWPIPKDVHDFLFDEAEVGEPSDVINVFNLFYIVELLEREDDRPLDDEQRRKAGDRDMETWLADLTERQDIEIDFTEGDLEVLVDDVF